MNIKQKLSIITLLLSIFLQSAPLLSENEPSQPKRINLLEQLSEDSQLRRECEACAKWYNRLSLMGCTEEQRKACEELNSSSSSISKIYLIYLQFKVVKKQYNESTRKFIEAKGLIPKATEKFEEAKKLFDKGSEKFTEGAANLKDAENFYSEATQNSYRAVSKAQQGMENGFRFYFHRSAELRVEGSNLHDEGKRINKEGYNLNDEAKRINKEGFNLNDEAERINKEGFNLNDEAERINKEGFNLNDEAEKKQEALDKYGGVPKINKEEKSKDNARFTTMKQRIAIVLKNQPPELIEREINKFIEALLRYMEKQEEKGPEQQP